MSDKQRAEEPLERIGIRAVKLAHENGHEYTTIEHLLSAILEEEEITRMFVALNIDSKGLKQRLDDYYKSGIIPPSVDNNVYPATTHLVERIMFRSTAAGKMSSKGRGDAVDVLLAMLKEKPEDHMALILLRRSGISDVHIKQFVTSLKHADPTRIGQDGSTPASNTEFKDRASAETYLLQYATLLNKKAAEGRVDPLIGREKEVQEAIQIFSRKKKNNPLLVGGAGVGKTAVVEGMAHLIINGLVPSVMANTLIYSLDIGALLAGTKYRGDFEERITKVIKAMTFIPKGVLFVDEIHMIMGAGSTSQGSMDAANMLKPALSDGSLRVIGSTTFEEFRKYFEKDRALLRRFGKINIDEPSLEDARKIIHGVAQSYADHHKVEYTMAALDAAVDLTHKYVNTGMLPDKAIDIIDMAGARLAVDDNKTSNLLDVSHIEAEVSRVAKIPEHTIKDDETTKLANLEEDLHAVVHGQNAAILGLVDAVFIARAGLREEDKTQGSYLFAGPTGTGKTHVAKQLAASLGIPLLRFDMSEYMEKHSVSKLIGAPPGYVGYDEGGGSGLLTNAIEQAPHCVLLLDEIEKAHPDIFNILLQVMDNGKLTNSGGKTVSFRNVWLIMTSNVGVREASQSGIGFGASNKNTTASEEAIKKAFSPEFRNRLDAQMIFSSLSMSDVTKIAVKLLDDLRIRVADRNVHIVVDDDAMAWLTSKGYDPAMGARPMKRVIADSISKPLSKMLVLGKLKDGGTVSVTLRDDGLVLTLMA